MAEKKRRGLKEALEQTRVVNSPLFSSSEINSDDENSRTKYNSNTLKNASRKSSEWANIIVKEDKNNRLSDLVKHLGINDNDKIQELKRYIVFKEAYSYKLGVKDGENGVKQEMRDLLGIENKEESDW